jgi:hypothetical protein
VSPSEESSQSLNWTAVAALYAAISLGFVWMLYWGEYRNAAWLALLGTGGGLTAYGRVLENRGQVQDAQRWKWAAGLVYGVFFLWAGTVLLRTLLRR